MGTTEFSERLKIAMEYRGKTAAEVAQGCGISKGLLSKYLSGKTVAKLGNVFKISQYLNVNTAYLMGMAENLVAPTYHVKGDDVDLGISEERSHAVQFRNALKEELMAAASKLSNEKLRLAITLINAMGNE